MKSTSTTLATLALLLGVAYPQESGPNCTAFTWDGAAAYIITSTPERVSGAATCPDATNQTHACPLVASGDDQRAFHYNISGTITNPSWRTSNGMESFFHALILPAVADALNGTVWNNSVNGVIDTTQLLEPGTSGYLNFMAYQRCFAGSLSNCTGEGVSDGMGIEACAPVYHTDRTADAMAILDGEYEVFNISAADVGKYKDPYARQTRSQAGVGIRIELGALMVAALAVGMAAIL